MKIKNIDFKRLDDKYVVYDIFNVVVDDDNIKELEFSTRKTQGTRALLGVKIVYASGTQRRYTVLKAPKKYKELFEKFLKNY